MPERNPENSQDVTFHDRLRTIREPRGITQIGLARAIGVDVSYLNRIEKGKRRPPNRDKVLKLAHKLGLEGEDRDLFITLADYSTQSAAISENPRAAHLNSLLTSASPEAAELAVGVLEQATSFIDNPKLKPRERRFAMILGRSLYTLIREIRLGVEKNLDE